MFTEFIEKLKEQYKKELPFVAYRKPQKNIVNAVLQKNSELHYVQTFDETGFVFSSFDGDRNILLQVDEFISSPFSTSKDNAVKKEDTIVLENDVTSKQKHIALVEKAIQQIEDGDFEKVVLSRQINVPFDATIFDVFSTILNTYPNAFCYLWYHPAVGCWLGATPEILLSSENKRITTMSLAGTMVYEEGMEPKWGNKELHEQELVTNYIAKVLENKVDRLTISERESFRAGNLWHLRSSIQGTLVSSLAEVVTALHPTPAVCGLPKDETQSFIEAHEGYDRSFYTGFLGELNFKSGRDRSSNKRNQENKAYRTVISKTALFVNLRCMQFKEGKAQIYVGGGITVDSNPEKEFNETVQKSKTMLKVLSGS